jgi:hypothetical protein
VTEPAVKTRCRTEPLQVAVKLTCAVKVSLIRCGAIAPGENGPAQPQYNHSQQRSTQSPRRNRADSEPFGARRERTSPESKLRKRPSRLHSSASSFAQNDSTAAEPLLPAGTSL